MQNTIPKHYRRYPYSFWRGFFSVLGGASLHGTFDPPRRYPRDAQRQDLERIGQDMYRAFERYDNETRTKQT